LISGDEKYIYLDWNVFKYMKEPRTDKGEIDKQFKELVFKLKNKYKFPFSYAHIRDRANRYSKEHYEKVKQDLEFVESISDSICVEIYLGEPVLYKVDIQDCFEDYISKEEKNTLNISTSFQFSYKVDMQKIDKNHPMYDFLLESNGMIDAKGMDEFLQNMYQFIFSDAVRYKKFRSYIDKIDLRNCFHQAYSYDELMQLNKLLYHLFPFIDSFQDNEEKLKKKWGQIAERWFSLNSGSVLKKEQLLIQGYTLLDMHPIFREKMKKGKNTLDNIVRDGNHCFYASQARFFVSEDEYTLRKTAFLYDVYNIKTRVVCENEFIKCFEVI
jgi:hypothetical protein